MSDAIEAIAGRRLLSTLIHRATDLSKATKERQSIFEFAGTSLPARAYRNLWEEIKERTLV